MSTLTIELPDELAARLAAASKDRKVSPGEMIREVLDRALTSVSQKSQPVPSLYDLMKNGIGCIDSGVPDLATNPEHLSEMGRPRP